MSTQFAILSHTGFDAGTILAVGCGRDLAIALGGWQHSGAYTRGPIVVGVGGSSAPRRRRFRT